MSTSVVMTESRDFSLPRRLSAFVELSKPRIAVMVLVAVAASAWVASWGHVDPFILLYTLIGTLATAAGASAANQWFERSLDARMPRTAQRPIPRGRITPNEALVFSLVTLAGGVAWLMVKVNFATAMLCLATWVLYVLVYTPLKTRTALNTFVGAIPGALPMLIGWTATEADLNLRAFSVFLTVFVWQFPHFMAIAWIYREQYDAAGYRMLTTVDKTGRAAGIQAIVGAAVLIPVSIVPVLFSPGWGAVAYAAIACLLGTAQWWAAWQFAVRRDRESARRLLQASLIYLPLLLGSLVCFPGR